jgi:ribosomal protein S18 acetylase RimI-like enzyme
LIQTVDLRKARPEDEPLLDELFYEDRVAQLAGIGLGEAQIRELVEMQARGRRTTYAAQFPAAEDSILLGEEGQPAGRLLLDRQADRWRIVDIAVLAARRGQRLGTKVVRQCQQRVAAAGARLELQVRPENPARRLYERLGFRVASDAGFAMELVWSAADGMQSVEKNP